MRLASDLFHINREVQIDRVVVELEQRQSSPPRFYPTGLGLARNGNSFRPQGSVSLHAALRLRLKHDCVSSSLVFSITTPDLGLSQRRVWLNEEANTPLASLCNCHRSSVPLRTRGEASQPQPVENSLHTTSLTLTPN